MKLFYTDDCPEDYQPELFEHSTEANLRFACAEHWTPQTVAVGGVDSGLHSSSLTVTFLGSHTRDDINELLDDTDFPAIPAELPQTLHRLADLDIQKSQPRVAWGAEPTESESEIMNDLSPSNRQADQIQNTSAKPKESKQPRRASTSGSVGPVGKARTPTGTTVVARHAPSEERNGSQISTQTRRDIQTKHELRELLQTPQATQSLEATQPLVPDSLEEDRDTEFLKSMAPLIYSQARLTELNGRTLVPTRRGEDDDELSTNDEHQIDCQCGHNAEEDGMICCDFCGKWQHTCCYGYLSLIDSRIPIKHACYVCLLDKNESDLLQDLSNLALLRKAVTIIKRNGGVRSVKSLSEGLYCDLPTASDVVRHLKGRGYLVDAPASHMGGSKRADRSSLVLVEDTRRYKQMMKELFDPTTNIAHHLASAPIKGRLLTQMTDASQLPSADPTSQHPMSLRSRKAAAAIRPFQEKPTVTRSSRSSRASERQVDQATKGSFAAVTAEGDTEASLLRLDLHSKGGAKRPSNGTCQVPRSDSKRLKISRACGELDVSYRSPSQASTRAT